MRILELVTFRQPNSNTIITLQREETPFYPPYSCERLVNDRRAEGKFGISSDEGIRMMKEWIKFEEEIKSIRL